MRLDSRVVSLAGGIVEASNKEEGVRKDLFDMVNRLSSKILAGFTGEQVRFEQGPRVMLDRAFQLTLPSPSPSGARFRGQPLYQSVDPALVIEFEAQYPPQAKATTARTAKPTSLKDRILQGAKGALDPDYPSATTVMLLVNGQQVATWAANQAAGAAEAQQFITVGTTSAKLSIQTQRVQTQATRGEGGQVVQRIAAISFRVVVERQDR